MIGGDYDHIFIVEPAYQFAETFVESIETAGITFGVVTVTVKHVRLHEIGKDESVALLAIGKHPVPHFGIRMSAQVHCDASAAENIVDLADGSHLSALLAKSVEQSLAERRDAVILSVCGAIVAALAVGTERARDDPAHVVLAGHDLPRLFAIFIKFFKRGLVDIACDLKHAVGGRIYDRLTRSCHLVAETFDYLGAALRAIAEHSVHAPSLAELLYHFVRETVGIGLPRLFDDKPCKFVVTGVCILALRLFGHSAAHADKPAVITFAGGKFEPHLVEKIGVEIGRYGAIGVAAFVTVSGGVRCASDAERVDNKQIDRLHIFIIPLPGKCFKAYRRFSLALAQSFAIKRAEVGLPFLSSTMSPNLR